MQKKLDVLGERQFQTDIKTMNETVDALIAERREHPSPKGEEDVLDVMLSATDPETGQGLSDENLRYQLVTFLIAGHETTSGMLSFAIYELIKSPHVLEKARGIVDEVLGDRFPEHDDIRKLGYLEQILRECLRLHPTVPAYAVTPRETTVFGKEATPGGVEVHPGDTCMVLLGLTHRDPKVWDRPEEFDPERFSFENAQKIPHNAWKPFGNGQRSCLGRFFAMQEATMVLALILKHFNFEFSDPNYKLKMLDFLTTKPEGLNIHVFPREGHPYRGRHAATEEAAAADDAPISGLEDHTVSGAADIEPNGHRVQVLVGSNSGTSRNFAGRLGAFATSQGYEVEELDLDDAVENVSTEGPVLICASSYEGLPTDNAKKFVDWLTSNPDIDLSGVHYAVFGSGNSEWAATFHRIPKLIDGTFASLGATRIVPRGVADMRSDFVGAFEDWEEELWPPVAKLEQVEHRAAEPQEQVSVEILDGGRGEVLRSENSTGYVTGVVESKEVLSTDVDGPVEAKERIDIRLPEGATYQTGDYLDVLPRNPKALVDRVLKRFRLDGESHVRLSGSSSFLPIGEPVSVRELLEGYVELGTPAGRKHIAALAEHCPCPPEAEALRDYASEERYDAHVQRQRRSVLDLLEEFQSVALPFEQYLSMLLPLASRRYSISSSALKDPSLASLTYSVINAPARSGRGTYEGVATSLLSGLREGAAVPVSVIPGQEHFRPDEDPERPMILVGAGTGMAPLRAFMEDTVIRANTAGVKPGKSLLFFGCHGPESDFLYHREFQEWAQSDAVEVHCAFSRHTTQGERGEIRYVQDKLWQDRAEVIRLLGEGARIFVCGDAERMAPAVRKVFTEIVADAEGLDDAAAKAKVDRMEHEDFTYVSDVFS